MDQVTIIFNSNRGSYANSADLPHEFDQLTFIGAPNTLQVEVDELSLDSIGHFIAQHPTSYIMGYLGYNLGRILLDKSASKNEMLTSLPSVFLVAVEKEKLIFNAPKVKDNHEQNKGAPLFLQQIVSKSKYTQQVLAIKKHIQYGNIYEINYCIPFVAENVEIDPLQIWERLNVISPMPFASFIDHPNFSVISASPERFIKKTGNQLFIQPMKGTKKKGENKEQDELLIVELKNDTKERSENVMIVDLTRNDLSKLAKRGSVKVNELFGIHSYHSIHQMVSTVSCNLQEDIGFQEILKATFPMGSMTGAPKSKAVDLIEELEDFSRGPYSGMLGYLNPNGDLDFSVLIRTIFYDKVKKKLFVAVGSAITSNSDVEKEYEECLIKLQPLLRSLNATII